MAIINVVALALRWSRGLMDKALRLLSRNPPKVKIGGSSPPGIESFMLVFSVFPDKMRHDDDERQCQQQAV